MSSISFLFLLLGGQRLTRLFSLFVFSSLCGVRGRATRLIYAGCCGLFAPRRSLRGVALGSAIWRGEFHGDSVSFSRYLIFTRRVLSGCPGWLVPYFEVVPHGALFPGLVWVVDWVVLGPSRFPWCCLSGLPVVALFCACFLSVWVHLSHLVVRTLRSDQWSGF